jgi:mannose-6-phosphate isomerase-like protein (cupin superfamily)
MLQVLAAVVIFSGTAAAQSNDSATFVTGDQIQAMSKELQPVTKGTSFRIVDVGNAYVGVAIQHRLKAEPGGKLGGPILHSNVSEVYFVTAGSATLATGGVMTDKKERKAGGEEGTGPGFDGTVAKPNDVRQIKAGDVVIIPRNMPHWFTAIPEDLTYLVVRIDPEKSVGLR